MVCVPDCVKEKRIFGPFIKLPYELQKESLEVLYCFSSLSGLMLSALAACGTDPDATKTHLEQLPIFKPRWLHTCWRLWPARLVTLILRTIAVFYFPYLFVPTNVNKRMGSHNVSRKWWELLYPIVLLDWSTTWLLYLNHLCSI